MTPRKKRPREEAVFFFDILGFSSWVRQPGPEDPDPLSYLAEFLGRRESAALIGRWPHRYALSDSVFLTHPDPLTAVDQACALFSSLFYMDTDTPALLRGAIAFGAVKHVPGVFLKASRNLVGPAVVDAVELEKEHGLKGPRIFLRNSLAQTLLRLRPSRVGWQLRATSAAGLWETLWMLPPEPQAFGDDQMLDLVKFTEGALKLFRKHAAHPGYGAHYRELLLVAAHSAARVEKFSVAGTTARHYKREQFLRADEVADACAATTGLPDFYADQLLSLLR